MDTTGSDPGLTFPDQPRLQLDQLLAQLVDRAQEVMATQGRLRGLLAATRTMMADLTREAVLQHIVEAARELIGARYAALGVIGPDGVLVEFIHAGMPADAVSAIGHLPEGKGLLGALIEDPGPIRLHAIADHPRSVGFPPGHPPMTSFLGVPIRIRDAVFGNLYLTDSLRGQFTAEDEELAAALAATGGVAIENARLYEAATSRGEWLQGSAATTREILAAEATDATGALVTIARLSRQLAAGDVVTVLRPCSDDELCIEVALGPQTDALVGRSVPVQGTLAGRVFGSGQPLTVAALDLVAGLAAETLDMPHIGPLLVLPLVGSRRVHGVLMIGRTTGRRIFTVEDLDMAGGFAAQAALAIELAEARADQQRAVLLDERQRIAGDLHDHVIQRLFAAGLSLQAVEGSLPPGRVADTIDQTIEDLDATIKQIRTTIFQLQRLPERAQRGVREAVLDVVGEVTPALAAQPSVRFAGPIEHTVPDAVVQDVLAVLREALTNVARHAGASTVTVDLTVGEGELTLEVHDDGRGYEDRGRRSGLATMAQRAERHGGRLNVGVRAPRGTTVQWRVPLPAAGTARDTA